MTLLLASLLAVAALVSGAAVVNGEVRLPLYFPTACARNSPNINECIRENMQTVMPFFAKGEPLFGLQKLDPVVVNEISGHVKFPPLDLYASCRNIQVYNVPEVIVGAVRAKLSEDKMDMNIDVLFRTSIWLGDFKMDGKFGNLPIKGHGPYNVTFSDLRANFKLIGSTEERNGEKYMKIKRFIPTLTIRDMKIRADNIVDGAPELSRTIEALVNRIWRPLIGSIMPATRRELEVHLKNMAGAVFDSVPYNQLFPKA